MKKIIFLLILILFTNTLYSEFNFNGELKLSEIWYIYQQNWQLSKDNFHLLDLYASKENEDESTKLKIRFQLRFKDYGLFKTSEDLSSSDKIMNYDIIPWEIWAEFNDIFINNLTLKAGKQYFEWGTADGIHPTSVLTPDDYSNPFQMGEKIPITAINLNYTFKSMKLYLIWIPQFIPAKLPEEFPLLNLSDYQVPGATILQVDTSAKIPDYQSDGMAKAVKFEFNLLNIDFSAGFFYGYDYLPQVETLNYTATTNITQLNLGITSFFPKMKVWTFDWTTSLSGLGFWGEVGIYQYDKKVVTSIFSPYGNSSFTAIDDKPYATYIIGADYSFKSGFYLNLQYSYGLPYVRGKDFLEDYLILSLKDSFLEDLLEIELANIVGFKRSVSFENNYEVMLMQKISYSFTDDLTMSVMINEIEARGDMLFKDWRDYDTISIDMEYNF